MARRSMSNALDLTPEKRAFITKDVRDDRTSSAAPDTQESPSESVHSAAAEQAYRPLEPAQHLRSAARPVQSEQLPAPYGGGLVQLSCRLRPELVRAVRRVLFEAKLAGDEKLTQQDIVEEALTEWLAARGQTL